MPASNWKAARRQNGETDILAVPAIYHFTVDTTGVKLEFANFTRSFQVQAIDGNVLVAFNRTALDAASSPNALTIVEGAPPTYEVAQTPAIYVKAVTGSVEVQFLVVLSDMVVPSDWGELTTANGFDGNDASAAITALT